MKNKYLALASISLVMLTLAMIIVPSEAYAALRISPAKVTVSANPGDIKTVNLQIQNVSGVGSTATVSYRNFTTSADESGSPAIIDQPGYSHGIQAWLSGVPSISLGPSIGAPYTATITVPKTAQPGSYYGVVQFVEGPLESAVASLIFVTVGHPTQQISIVSIDTSQITTAVSGKLGGSLTVRIKNTANAFTVPTLKVSIVDGKGTIITTFDANPENGGVLPGGIRKYNLPLSTVLNPAKAYAMQLTATLTTGVSLTTERALPTTPGVKPLHVQTKVVMFTGSPAKSKSKTDLILLASLIGLAVLVIVVIVVRKRRKKPISPTIQLPLVPSDSAQTVVTPSPSETVLPAVPNDTLKPPNGL